MIESAAAHAIVRRCGPADVARCVRIAAALPDYFSAEALGEISADLNADAAWVCETEGRVLGFCSVQRRWAGAAEIRWLAVDSERRNTGLGTLLLGQVLRDLAADGVRVVEAKTLDRSSGYEPYRGTWAFWERRGFVQVDMIDPLPGWQPGNPCAVYVAAL